MKSRILTFPAGSRLLVFAPHPDDETLATGELIQMAREAGAPVRVVFATDGDNNPWPQRWSERRWGIGDRERARWGQRRRSEAIEAIKRLGVDAANVRFLGWPDQGLTDQLLRNERAIDELANEIAAYAPTHVAMPSMRDRHPDHGSLRVMADLALAKTQATCVRLGYVVHGRTAEAAGWHLPPDANRQQRKRGALMAHASQIVLSKNRLLRWAQQEEWFEHLEPKSPLTTHAPAMESVLRIPLTPAYRYLRRHEFLIVLAEGDRIVRARVPLPRVVQRTMPKALGRGLCGGRVAVDLVDGVLQVTFAASSTGRPIGYVKIERSFPRVVIFDASTWQRLEDFPALSDSAARIEPVAVAQRASL